MKPLVTISILAISAGQLSASTMAGILWQTRRLLGGEMTVHELAHDGSGKVVAVAENGTIRTSIDHGNNWSAPAYPSKLDLKAICWTGSEWLAGGGEPDTASVILKSPDASSWLNTCLGDRPPIECLSPGGPRIVALGSNGALARSTDASSWLTSTDSTQSIRDVTWTGSQFVAVGEAGAIKTSPDGLTWTAQTSGVPDVVLLDVAWSGSELVAVGHDESFQSHVLRSTDGITWTLLPAGSLPGFLGTTLLVEWTETSFVVVGLGLAQAMASTSLDGLTWNTTHILPSSWVIAPVPSALCWTGAQLVAGDGGGQILVTDDPTPNATGDWRIQQPAGAPWRLFDLTMADVSGTDRIVFVGDQFTVLISDDNGTNITEITSGSGPSVPALYGITSTTLPTRKFIAAGKDGTIVTSNDGGTWFDETSSTTNDLRDITWFEPITPGTKVAVAVGADGEIRSSTNGSNWADRSVTTTNDLHGVAGGIVIMKPADATSRLVAVGENGAVYISSSGTTWTAAPGRPTIDLLAVTGLDSGFVAVGEAGSIFTSPDGLTWTSRSSPTDQPLNDVTWTGTQVVAVGESGTVLTSPNGITWTRRYSSHPKALNGILPLLSGRLGAVGVQGIIITSDPAMDFADWMDSQPPTGLDDPDDDPNGDGITNLVAYGHGIPAVGPSSPADLARLPRLVDPVPGQPTRIRLGVNDSDLGDAVYIIDWSPDLTPGSWTEILRHTPGQECSTGSAHVHSEDTGFAVIEIPEVIGALPSKFYRTRTELTP